MSAINDGDRRLLPRPQRVLVVDDDQDIRHLWETWLTFWGFTVQEATNGLDAIMQASSFHPNIVLMDIWMPALDGLSATRRLKADPDTRDVPVLALSADAYPPAPQNALAAGCEAFLQKPVHPDALLEAIRDALRRASDDARGGHSA